MCVIAVSPLGIKVDAKVFHNMWEANDHGFGMVFRTQNGAGILKGLMTEQEAWEWYTRIPEGVPHALHFRLATHGGVRPELTHPFIVSEESPLEVAGIVKEPVLLHNGIWHLHTLKEVELKGPVSDSRILAAWLGTLLRERPLKEAIRQAYYEIESAGRVVVIDPSTWEIITIGDWIEDGGVLYSNASYKGWEARLRAAYGYGAGACDWREVKR